MNQPLQEFVAAHLPFPGLAAWSVRLRDRTFASHSYVQWLPSSRAEEVLARLALAADGLRQYRLDPVRLCYRFEHLRCHLAARRDGVCLALLVQNLPQGADTAEVNALEAFANL